jgi:type IV secretory pathway VirB2 component (pilin)
VADALTVSRPGAGLRAATRLAFALLVVTLFGAAFIRFAHGDASLEGAAEVARWIYRVAAIAFVLVVAGVAVLGWDTLRGGARFVLGAQIVLAVALAFLGRVTPSSDHPLVAFGNPLGGLALVGLGWWLVLAASPPPVRPARPLAGWALVAAAFAAIAALVVWRPGLAAGLVVQLAATVALVAGVTAAYRRDA